MTTDVARRVDPARLGSLALAAALVGLAAGLVAAVFATVAAEPAIDDAIAIEEAAEAASADNAGVAAGSPGGEGDGGGHDGEAVVSRSHQRGVGLFAAYGLTGAAFGLLVALTAHGLRHRRPDPASRARLAGAVLGGAITVAPWLKYPPNPPAVGDPDTLAERQSYYVIVILATVALGLGALALAQRLRDRGRPDHVRHPAVAAAVVVPLLALFAVLPGAPDDIGVPAALVWRFRLASLGANLTLWAVLTLGLAWLVAGATARHGAASPTGPAGTVDDPAAGPAAALG